MELTEHIIEAYCKEQLSIAELSEFERELKSNPDLQEEVREMLTTLSALEEIRSEALKQRLSLLEGEVKVRKLIPQPQWIRWAAAISIIAIAGYYIFEQYIKANPEEIYLAYFEPYPNVIDPGTRSGEEVSVNGLRQYDAGDYKSAFYSLKEVTEKNPQDLELTFYYDISA